ncbi:AzlD domain-containing protein [Lysinibacillus sp. 3P01SB]|uniref:AzlD domain-containing protein n=1 Tax=Lysinibacillus sp. 3P01SB TaxID=3132284 RepID=UPI0039A546C7
MTTSVNMLLLLLGCALVTWLPRIIPFLFVKSVELPNVVLRWLKYIPICILSALVFESMFEEKGHFVVINSFYFFAAIPTLAIAVWTKSLSKTVLVGVASMALLRLFFE